MILFTLGTIHMPFRRMAETIKKLIQRRHDLDILVQSGHTYELDGLNGVRVEPFIQQNKLWRYMSQARVVCMHGGEGSILDAMEWCPNQPVLFPRNSSFGEHVDSYQEEIVKSVTGLGWGVKVDNPGDAVDQIIRLNEKPKSNPMYKQKFYNRDLVKYLSEITTG